MKPLIVSFACLTLVACGGAAMPPAAPTITLAPGASTLSVRVERVKTDRGPVICDLFNAADGFPGPSPIIGGSLRVEASAEPVCVWQRLPAGDYAVSVIQDENGNGDLDSNFLGVPLEGYGASNNVLPPTSGPLWSDSRFPVDGAAPVTLTVRLLN
ncbi:MAG: DUF2141 domain-containing protein [Myxococcaceae bacterium]|jgi:uncharacterized protein (DUF2141 family)|nr:DUF2141 domain-containing protein [Myxococcaceae bacterium]MCA3012242.1 DUF2141 domain-containing protein [Myxococcaceae bacterium]